MRFFRSNHLEITAPRHRKDLRMQALPQDPVGNRLSAGSWAKKNITGATSVMNYQIHHLQYILFRCLSDSFRFIIQKKISLDTYETPHSDSSFMVSI